MLLDKISVGPIISDHADTLRDYGTGKRSISDVCVFFGLPMAVAAVAVWTGIRIRVSAVTAILTASAIFVGLLPNLLILVLTFLMNAKGDASDSVLQLRKRFMREIAAHVSFSFVLSLALASIAVGALMLLRKDENPLGAVPTFLLVVGSVTLVLTMLMLIRRMHALVVSEFDRHKLKAA
jgi:hypothetical protein